MLKDFFKLPLGTCNQKYNFFFFSDVTPQPKAKRKRSLPEKSVPIEQKPKSPKIQKSTIRSKASKDKNSTTGFGTKGPKTAKDTNPIQEPNNASKLSVSKIPNSSKSPFTSNSFGVHGSNGLRSPVHPNSYSPRPYRPRQFCPKQFCPRPYGPGGPFTYSVPSHPPYRFQRPYM